MGVYIYQDFAHSNLDSDFIKLGLSKARCFKRDMKNFASERRVSEKFRKLHGGALHGVHYSPLAHEEEVQPQNQA